MSAHLTEEQISELALGMASAETTIHLQSCDLCRAETDHLRNVIACYRDATHAQAQRDSIFWTRQSYAVRDQLAAHGSVPLVQQLGLASIALALVAVFLLILTPRPLRQADNPVAVRAVVSDSADDILLQEVQTDVDRDFPTALAPAVLISQERNSAISTQTIPGLSQSNQKEQQQ